jgi:hypothetical protein
VKPTSPLFAGTVVAYLEVERQRDHVWDGGSALIAHDEEAAE